MHAVEPALDPYVGAVSHQRRPVGEPAAVAPRVLLLAPEGGRSSLVEGLRTEGLAVVVAPDGAHLALLETGGVDLVLLHSEVSRARADLEQVRAHSAVPVVVALRDSKSALEGFLEGGADDCVANGVPRSELAARIRAVLRRRQRPGAGEVLRSGAFVMDLARHVFHHDGRQVHLPPKEFGLLELLLRRDGRVVSREEALEVVWGHSQANGGMRGDPTTVDVHVKRLRAKVEVDPATPRHLLTVRGLGYRFEP